MTALEKKNKMVYHTYKSPSLSSFEKQKEFVLALSKTTDQKEDGYKETHNICK